jgi:hypothetical protein
MNVPKDRDFILVLLCFSPERLWLRAHRSNIVEAPPLVDGDRNNPTEGENTDDEKSKSAKIFV